MLHGPAKARLNASKGGNYGYALLVVVNVPIRKSITGGSLPFGPFIAMGIAACLCSRVICLKCGASPQALGIGLEMEIRDKVGPFVIEAAGWRWREESQDTNTQDPAEASPTLNGRRMEQILRLKSSTRSGLPAKPEVASPSPHREWLHNKKGPLPPVATPSNGPYPEHLRQPGTRTIISALIAKTSNEFC